MLDDPPSLALPLKSFPSSPMAPLPHRFASVAQDNFPSITQKMDKPATDSSRTSHRSSHIERKSSGASNRRERAKELHHMSMHELVELVLQSEHKVEKSEARLKKVALKFKEQTDAEKQALEQAKKYRQKMTQVVLDTQQEALKAKQDMEQYKLKLENAQREIQREKEAVKILEEDKEEIERELHRTKDRAREYRERSAVQLAREQGRRIGFEQGLDQGRFVVQLAHARASLSQPEPEPAPEMRRAITQGPDVKRSGDRRHHTRYNSLDESRSFPSAASETRPPARRSSVGSVAARENHATAPPERLPSTLLQQAPSDAIARSNEFASRREPLAEPPSEGGRSSRASGAQQSHRSLRPANGNQRTEQPDPDRNRSTQTKPAAYPQRSSTPPGRPLSPTTAQRPNVQPIRPFGSGVPVDDTLETPTSPDSSMPEMLTFSDQPGPRKLRGAKRPGNDLPSISEGVSAPSNAGPSVGVVPPRSMSEWPPKPPDITINPPPDDDHRYYAAPTHLDGHLLNPAPPPLTNHFTGTSSHTVSRSNRSSASSWEFKIEPPSQPNSPPFESETSTTEDYEYLSPNSRPRSLPHPSAPDPHGSPVLPILPRFGTPTVHPADLATGVIPSAHYTQPVVPNDTASYSGGIYEEAPTPPGFRYPIPLGAAPGSGKGKSDDGHRSFPYASPSQSPGLYPGTPVFGPYGAKSGKVDSPPQPVVPSVTSPFGGGANYTGLEDDEDDSFDSDTRRNTQMNAQLYRPGGNW